jgi:hypothetical protein
MQEYFFEKEQVVAGNSTIDSLFLHFSYLSS